jgi:lipopolysaccharide export system protein LptC
MMLRLLALGVLIGIAVGLTEWLQDLQEELERTPPERARAAPDFTFENIVLTVMGIDGKPRYRIRAPRMVHYPPGHSARIASPHLWFYAEDGPPIELRAQRARVDATGEPVWLLGGVDIRRPAYARRASLEVQTRDVKVLPEANRALTEAPVAATRGEQRMAGVGMALDLAVGTLDLLSRVRGTYVP